ncbi:MAG TPA: hypothetical protein VMD27_13715 [Candidatus Aquilonibacter sp.]|nr:hypothetical protein [Candidatus Aquilonibacter sp.]
MTRLKLKRNQGRLASAAAVMKKSWIALALALTASLSAPKLHAQITTPDNPDPNWISFGPQLGFNIKARFNHVGNVNPMSPGPATGGDVDRTYDDGFVHVDSSGDAGGQTWNWGYQNDSQVQGNTLVMHSVSTADGSLGKNADLPDGFDLAFGRRLGTVRGIKWGAQAAFDFTHISIWDDDPFSGSATLISDAFSLGGTTPPQAPYSGSFNGPGPLLGDTPTRTTASETVAVTGERKLDAQVYALRLGPYFEFPLGERCLGRLGGGLALAVADTRYSFNETISYGGGKVVNNTASGSGAEFNAGGYLEGKLSFDVTSCTSFFAGAQYEYLGTFSCNAGGEQAQLKMGNTVYVLFGLQMSF